MVVICPYIEDIKPEITIFLLTSNGFVFQATHDGCDFARGGISFFMEFAEKTSSVREGVKERLELRTPFDFVGHFARNRRVASNHELVSFRVNDYSLICAINLFCAHIITRIDTITNVSFDIFFCLGQSPVFLCFDVDKIYTINISVHIVLLYNSFIILILYFKFHKKSNLFGI